MMPFTLYKENRTQRGFLLGGVDFIRLSCSVKFTVKFTVPLKPTRSISWPLLALSRVAGQLLVPCPSCQAWPLLPVQSPAEPQQAKTDWGHSLVALLWMFVTELCPLSSAGAATHPGPLGLQPRLSSHCMREKQWNDKRKFLTLFTGFFPPSLCLGLCWI